MTEYNPKNKHSVKKSQRAFIKAMKQKFGTDDKGGPSLKIQYGDHITLIPYAKGGETPE